MKEKQIAYRLIENPSDEFYEACFAKKKNGYPKDDYPSLELAKKLKDVKLKNNLLSVIINETAISSSALAHSGIIDDDDKILADIK